MAGEITCAKCGALQPPDSRFCDQCGTALTPVASPPPPPPGAPAPQAPAGAPSDPAAPTAPKSGASRLLIPVIAGVVALLLAGGGVAAWWFTTNSAAPVPATVPIVVDDEAGSKPTRTPSAAPSASVTPTAPPVAAVAANHEFKSQSGNLRCSVGEIEGEPGAICQQVNINYAYPGSACPSADGSVFVGVGPDGTFWPCIASFAEPGEVIAYDTPVTQNGITCSINLNTGVTCTNTRGRGFTMEYDAGVRTF